MPELLKSTLIFFISLLIYWLTKDYPLRSLIYIRFLLYILFVLSVLYIISSLKSLINSKGILKERWKFKLRFNPELIRLLSLIVILVLYVVGLKYIGYFVSTLAFIWITMFVLGDVNKKSMVVLPVILLGSIYLFFNILLKIQLPMGLLF